MSLTPGICLPSREITGEPFERKSASCGIVKHIAGLAEFLGTGHYLYC